MPKEFDNIQELFRSIRRDLVRNNEDILNAMGQEAVNQIRKSMSVPIRAHGDENRMTIEVQAKGEDVEFTEKRQIFDRISKHLSDNFGNILKRRNII